MDKETIMLATPDLDVRGNTVLTAYEPGSGDTLARRSLSPLGQIIIIEKMLTALRLATITPQPTHNPLQWHDWVPGHGYHP